MLERGLLVPIILSWCFLELSLQVAVSLHVPAPLAAAACPCCPSCHGRRLMRTEQTGETGDSDARHRLRRHRRFCLGRHVFHNDTPHMQRRQQRFCLVRHVCNSDTGSGDITNLSSLPCVPMPREIIFFVPYPELLYGHH